MRFTDDDDLSFCLTISTGIKRGELLAILGVVEALPLPQTFNDFAYETHQPGRKGLLNVFEDGAFLITVENNGYLGVTRRTVNKVRDIGGLSHYVSLYYSGDNGHQYVEIESGDVLANFDPAVIDEIPSFLLGSSGPGIEFAGDFARQPRRSMIRSIEYRMMTTVQPAWLEQPTDTYMIDYRTDRD